MTGADLDSTLNGLGWRGIDLANRLKVSPVTVSGWRRGHAPVPGYVEEYLRVVVLVREMAGRV